MLFHNCCTHAGTSMPTCYSTYCVRFSLLCCPLEAARLVCSCSRWQADQNKLLSHILTIHSSDSTTVVIWHVHSYSAHQHHLPLCGVAAIQNFKKITGDGEFRLAESAACNTNRLQAPPYYWHWSIQTPSQNRTFLENTCILSLHQCLRFCGFLPTMYAL